MARNDAIQVDAYPVVPAAPRALPDEDQFRRIFEAAPHAMLTIDQHGIIGTANAQALSVFGYARAQLLGQPVELLLPEPVRGGHAALRAGFFAAPAQRAMGAGRDLFARRLDGSVFPAEISLTPIDTGSGTTVLAVVVDITERQRIAARLHDTLSLQAAIVASASDAIISETSAGVITSWNAGAERMFGFTAQECIGHTLADMIAPGDAAEEERARLAEINATGGVAYFETRRRRKDGRFVEVAVALSPITDTAGHRVGYAAVKRDLSAQRRADARFRMVVEAAPTAIVMVNRRGAIEIVNAQAERLFDTLRHAMLGQPVAMLLPERLLDGQPFDAASFFARATARGGGSLQARRRDGSEVPVELALSPIETEEGPMLLAFITDISERVSTGRRLAGHRAELQRSNEQLATFAYVASHDLKSPLRGIFQLALWIDEDTREGRFDAIGGYVKLLHSRLQRMENLLDDLLAYARVGTNRGGLSPVAVADLARSLYDTEMPSTGIRLELADDLPRFTTCAAPFAQVLRNLFSNAIKHHDRVQGCICLSAAAADAQHYAFTVADDGPGIPEQYHDRVFAMFQTLRPRDEIEGSGMGLALVKKIIEGFGGKVWIAPQQGRGCCVTFTWPHVIDPSKLGETDSHETAASA